MTQNTEDLQRTINEANRTTLIGLIKYIVYLTLCYVFKLKVCGAKQKHKGHPIVILLADLANGLRISEKCGSSFSRKDHNRGTSAIK